MLWSDYLRAMGGKFGRALRYAITGLFMHDIRDTFKGLAPPPASLSPGVAGGRALGTRFMLSKATIFRTGATLARPSTRATMARPAVRPRPKTAHDLQCGAHCPIFPWFLRSPLPLAEVAHPAGPSLNLFDSFDYVSKSRIGWLRTKFSRRGQPRC